MYSLAACLRCLVSPLAIFSRNLSFGKTLSSRVGEGPARVAAEPQNGHLSYSDRLLSYSRLFLCIWSARTRSEDRVLEEWLHLCVLGRQSWLSENYFELGTKEKNRRLHPTTPRSMLLRAPLSGGLIWQLGKTHFVYILDCGGRYLYTGYTVDLARRIYEHSRGAGSKFTRSHLPVSLVYSESLESRSEALKREISIKRLTRAKKLTLIKSEKKKSPK